MVSHFVPLPTAYCWMCLLRSCTPKHVELQFDHSVHSDTLQSWLCWHGGNSSHMSNSSSKPTACFPHCVAFCAMSRCLTRKAGAHSEEHLLHWFQSPQTPSTHLLQESVLHGSTSSFALASHNAPPCLGGVAIVRRRRFVPPPQVVEQPLQSSQSLQAQSTRTQGLFSQAMVSFNAAVHPFVWPAEMTDRDRIATPKPHSAEHDDHAAQSDSWQTSFQHAAEPHAPVSRMLGGSLRSGKTQCSRLTMCLVRSRWPSHVAVQPDQPVQSDSLQLLGATARFTGHPIVSSSLWLQCAPSPSAGISTARLRYFWWGLAALQPSQSVHESSTHGAGATQECTLHGSASRVGSPSPKSPSFAQGLPPHCASCTTRRERNFQPVPQSRLQVVHPVHSDTLQSNASDNAHGLVMFQEPSQGWPPKTSLTAIFRSR
mmetsp:Transcript_43991/g.124256  ORF Transcript_43991/g.124256 Transcript_43991/m.124256 type:complete len:428 (-) Transcript_43991:193-1476(-)